MDAAKPSVGRVVHYVAYGTPGGEFPARVCRAAIVTEVNDEPNPGGLVGVCVLNPTGQFFNRSVLYDDGSETPGSPDCTSKSTHGAPFRFCACGWIEARNKPGTWHWPERV